MFLGTHEPRLDDKGRLILPAKFRDELAAGLVITKGQERCLYVFPSQEFSVITETLKQAPVTAKSARDYSRVMFAGAHDEIPDRQGRVTIPQSLRTYAGLEKECVVIGANTRVEIWDATAWNEYLTDREKSFAEVSEEVFPGLFQLSFVATADPSNATAPLPRRRCNTKIRRPAVTRDES